MPAKPRARSSSASERACFAQRGARPRAPPLGFPHSGVGIKLLLGSVRDEVASRALPRTRTRRIVGCLFVSAIAFANLTAPAGAGINGLIAFETADKAQTINTVDPVNVSSQPADAGGVSGQPADPVNVSTEPAVPRTVPGLLADSANAAWSPDGTMLAFSRAASGSTNIYVINANGTGLRPITQAAGASIDPTWSPDGRQIAFASMRDGERDIYVTDIDGAAPQRLTTDPGVDQQPDWSPDGQQIAFESNRAGSYDIWLMASDGSAQTPLTTDPADESDADWSPDSRRLAFSSGPPASYQREIFSIDRLGGDRKQLTRLSARSAFPAWSPDGKQLVFEHDYRLLVMPSSGVATTGLSTFVASNATDPDWARLPEPVAKPEGTVSVTPPGGGPAVAATGQQALAEGTKVNATEGSLLVSFRRPAVPETTPPATTLVEGAAFTIAKTTPEAVSLRLTPRDCSTAPVMAAKVKRRKSPKVKRRKSRVTAKGGKGGGYRILTKRLIAASYGTEFAVIETCRGSLVKVKVGRVRVQLLTAKRRRVVNVRAGGSYFLAAKPL